MGRLCITSNKMGKQLVEKLLADLYANNSRSWLKDETIILPFLLNLNEQVIMRYHTTLCDVIKLLIHQYLVSFWNKHGKNSNNKKHKRLLVKVFCFILTNFIWTQLKNPDNANPSRLRTLHSYISIKKTDSLNHDLQHSYGWIK